MDKENIKLLWEENKGVAAAGKGSPAMRSSQAAKGEAVSFPCGLCGKSFSQKHSLARHLKSHTSGDGHSCFKCKKTFAAVRDLKKHIDIVHFNKAEDYKKECPICHARVQQLKTHIRFIHRNEGKSSEYNCVCPQCDKTFSNDYKVKRHIQTVHEGVKNWQCTICPKRFYDKKDLGRHVKGVHMGQKVDTWRSKTASASRKSTKGQVVVTKNFLSTVDVSAANDQITLPVNVLDEEEKSDAEDNDETTEINPDHNQTSDVPEFPASDKIVLSTVEAEEVSEGEEEMEVSELDPVFNSELDCRFQVCEQRLDEEGNLVLEIEEKTEASSSPVKPSPHKQMVTLRWGDQGNEEKVDSTGDKHEKMKKTSDKVMDLNLKLEEIIEENTSSIPTDDFVLPEVVGDLPDWFLNTSNELDILKMNQSTDNTEIPVNKEDDTNTKTAYRCGACGKMFISLEFLKSHMEQTHANQKISNEEECAENDSDFVGEKYDTIICNINGCEKTFEGKAKKPQYKRHLERVHLSVKNKECPKCELKFYEQRDLNRHMEAIHLGMKTVCPEAGCSKPVVRLDQHMRMVHGAGSQRMDKSTKCPECGANFSRVYDMTRHRENVHRGVKNFRCDKCDRKFSDKRDLKRHHDAVHLNIKQKKLYSCSSCDKSFKFKKQLDLHRHNEHESDTPVTLTPFKPSDIKTKEPGSVTVTLNNTKAKEGSMAGAGDTEAVNTVELDGQLYIVQHTGAGISLLPLVRSGDSDTITLAVEDTLFSIEK